MVNIEAGVAEARVVMNVVSVTATTHTYFVAAVPNGPRPVSRFLSQGRTSLSAVSPDANIRLEVIAVA